MSIATTRLPPFAPKKPIVKDLQGEKGERQHTEKPTEIKPTEKEDERRAMIFSTTTVGEDEPQANDSSAPTTGTTARTTVYIRKPRTIARVVGDASTDNAQSSKEAAEKLDVQGLKVQADSKKSEAASEKGKNDHAGGNKGASTLKEKTIYESKAFKEAPDAPSFSLGFSQEDEHD